MAIFKARTRKPSLQTSVVDSTPVVPQAQARSQLPSATPASRISHIFSIPPCPGMRGILITDGVQMTIEYVREIPYTGQLPTQSPAIVKPVPKFRVGNQLPLFVDGRHFIALIKEVAPHTRVVSEDVPRVTQIFDFPTTTADETSFLDFPLSKPSTSPQNELGLLPIPEVSGIHSIIYPTPPPDASNAPVSPRRESPMSSTRTRAKTLSTAALNISRTDQEAFQRVHDRFFATSPAPTQIKATPPAAEALQFPSSPRRPSDAVPHSSLQNRNIPPTSPRNPSPAPQQQQNATSWFGRARTASDVDENRPTQPWRRRNLRPSGSSNTFAAPSTITPAPCPRPRLRSDAGPTPRSNGALARSSTVLEQGRAQSQAYGRSQWTIRKPVPHISQVLDADQPLSKSSSFFKFGMAKAKVPLWSNGSSILNKGMTDAHMVTTTPTTEGLLRGALVDAALPYSDIAPSIPMPSGLRPKEGSGLVDVKGVSWVSFKDLPQGNQASSPPGRTELILDLLSTQEQKLRDRKPSQHATTEGPPGDNQRRKRNGFVPMPASPYDGRGMRSLRVPTASPGPSTMSSLPTIQSRAESRRNSSRKELPPIPVSGPHLYSPESLVYSHKEEKANENEWRRGPSKEKSLGNALDLTPPLSPIGSIPSTSHSFAPTTPSSSVVRHYETYQLYSAELPPPNSPGSSFPAAVIPDARLTTFQVPRMGKGKEHLKYDAMPTPLEQMRARPPHGSILSFTTQTAHDAVVRSTSESWSEAPPNESTSTVSAGGSRQVYETAPSSVDELR
ncbi:hypothetical protein BJ912DRAFT_623319 [Pholiota molesta]|nr:hypothetical protein BJ912DRAFT_623319 [Pholiota molesta]